VKLDPVGKRGSLDGINRIYRMGRLGSGWWAALWVWVKLILLILLILSEKEEV
jgi:hypothetical protein